MGNSPGVNFFGSREFSEIIREVRKTIPKERNLETPQVLIEKSGEGYSATYNAAIQNRIKEKLDGLQRVGENRKYIDSLSKQVTKEREWIVKNQVVIVNYLCATQGKYLQSVNVLDLNPLSQKDVGKVINYTESTVSRLVRNLSVKLPSGRVIFAGDLIPGYSNTSNKGVYAIRQLQNDPQFYENGKWKISDFKLVPILKERFGIEVARRTVGKYKSLL